jgi:hypothetical protein
VAANVLQRAGSRSLVVNGLYQQFLGRQPDDGGGEVDRALTRLKRGRTFESLADSILGSQEYFDRAIGDFDSENKFDGVIASFRDANPNSKAADFTAMIDWGDTAVDAGVITLNRGLFHVTGMHVFANKGTFAVNVKIIGGNQMVNALSSIELTPECPADVSDSITVVRREAKFDVATGQTTQKVTLTNTGATPIVGPLYFGCGRTSIHGRACERDGSSRNALSRAGGRLSRSYCRHQSDSRPLLSLWIPEYSSPVDGLRGHSSSRIR